MKVIALTGRAGSGKDTAAALLQFMTASGMATHSILIDSLMKDYQAMPFSTWNPSGPVSHHFHVFKFAWPVYQVIGILLNRSPDEIMSDSTFKNKVQYQGLTGRQLLQKIGTECFRDVLGESVWCDVMHKNLVQDIPGAIISDLRFTNEAEFLKKHHNAVIIKLVGRNNGTPQDHPSESQIDSITPDYTILNDKGYEYLAWQLEKVCKKLNILNAKYTWK